jgi:hypothetical protein
MNDMKKEWIKPTLTKVKLEFDKEMSNNCSFSANPSKNVCQQDSGSGCWSNPNYGDGSQS